MFISTLVKWLVYINCWWVEVSVSFQNVLVGCCSHSCRSCYPCWSGASVGLAPSPPWRPEISRRSDTKLSASAMRTPKWRRWLWGATTGPSQSWRNLWENRNWVKQLLYFLLLYACNQQDWCDFVLVRPCQLWCYYFYKTVSSYLKVT